MDSVHLSTARRIMEQDKPFSIKFLTADARVVEIESAVSLKWDLRTGTRTIKAIPSGQIRRIRDSLILEINSLTVYL